MSRDNKLGRTNGLFRNIQGPFCLVLIVNLFRSLEGHLISVTGEGNDRLGGVLYRELRAEGGLTPTEDSIARPMSLYIHRSGCEVKTSKR